MKLLIKSMLAVAAMLLTFNLSVAEAASGPAGPAGPKGATGATGPMGLKGNPGFPGLLGPKGAAGAAGADGIAGSVGAHAVNGTVIGQILVWDGTAWTPTIPKPCLWSVGYTGPDGGKVAWVDSTGCHGLEAQLTNVYVVGMSGYGVSYNDAILGAAEANSGSSLITSACSRTNAQGYPECWHVPSSYELNLILQTTVTTTIGNFTPGWYWAEDVCRAPNITGSYTAINSHWVQNGPSTTGCGLTATGEGQARAVRTF